MDEIRRCKKCGCELASESKFKLCESCRRNNASKWRTGIEVTGAIIATICSVLAVSIGVKKTK